MDDQDHFDWGKEYLRGQIWFRPEEAVRTQARSVFSAVIIILVSFAIAALVPVVKAIVGDEDTTGALLILVPIGAMVVWYVTCKISGIPMC
jgi:VIT1/CCC1 family predicted Fe2+/Mn2+ transporter